MSSSINNTQVILVSTSLPEGFPIEPLAKTLLEKRLAACIQVTANVNSYYHWNGQLENSNEKLLHIKTTIDRYAALEKELLAQHPYELPEITGIKVDTGLPEYLNWVHTETTDKTIC